MVVFDLVAFPENEGPSWGWFVGPLATRHLEVTAAVTYDSSAAAAVPLR